MLYAAYCLRAQYKAGLKALERVKESVEFDHEGRKLSIELVPNHYYLPVLLDEHERADYIKHVIRTPSEVRFVRDLERYLREDEKGFGEYDWWPSRWLGGFVHRSSSSGTNQRCTNERCTSCWLAKGRQYHIVFVDPKGMAHTRTYQKLDGYRHLFEVKDQPRRIAHEGVTATVQAFCYNRDAAQAMESYRRFWAGTIPELLQKVSA